MISLLVMSFLDNFRFAFQDISLLSKKYKTWKYGEKIDNSKDIINFEWVIQKHKDFGEFFIWKANNIKYTSKDFELRSNINIIPKKWDIIESYGNEYDVIYTEKIIIEWVHDHNLAIIRLTN